MAENTTTKRSLPSTLAKRGAAAVKKGQAARTKVKYDDSGNKIGGGTAITDSLIQNIIDDDNVKLEIQNNNIEQFKSAMNQAVAKTLEEIGLAAERFAKSKCPVDTGRLRNSITHAIQIEGDGGYVVIGTNVEYARYVELGIGQKPQPYLKPAGTDHMDYYRNIARKNLNGDASITAL